MVSLVIIIVKKYVLAFPKIISTLRIVKGSEKYILSFDEIYQVYIIFLQNMNHWYYSTST